jgi:DNA-binding transcriptional LysR family regulator
VTQLVLDGRCRIGIVGTLPTIPHELQASPLLDIRFVSVVAPTHPLSTHRRVISKSEIGKHIQLVLSDPTTLSDGRNFGVISSNTWRLADMGAKHAFLKAGFGWGQMPLHMVANDIRDGTLVKIQVEGAPARTQVLPMYTVHRKDALPGPAAQALIEWLRHPTV